MATNRDWSNGRIELPSASDVALSGFVTGGADPAWSLLADGTLAVKSVAPATRTTFTQTYATTTATVPTQTATTVATDAATATVPYGYSEAQANAIVTAVNALVADVLANRKLINALIDALQAAGTAL